MNYTLVGVFVLVLATTLVTAVLWLASGGGNQKRVSPYIAIVEESVAGLNLNAPVKYNGVDVGKVTRIELDVDDPNRVNLLFAIERGTPIKEDTVAVLRTQGLTGIAYVELSGGARASPMLRAVAGRPYPEIRTKPSLTARLENVLTSVLSKVDETSTNINAMLSAQNQAALTSALGDIASVARTLAARKDTIDSAITRAARTLENTTSATARLGPVLERIGRSADAIDAMGTEVARASAGAGKTLDTVGADIQRISAQTLPELERLLGELSALTVSLRRLSEQTERDPRGLLFGRQPVPPGPGEPGSVP